tara:strand:+ start:243 stop:788 length:546 start_codon:yes stop_codon:yes gene_type:complete
MTPFDKDGKWVRKPVYSKETNKNPPKPSEDKTLITCLGCMEKIPKDAEDCPKCGRRTPAGKMADFAKKNKNQKEINNQKAKSEIALGGFVLVVLIIGLIGGCVAIVNEVTKEKPKTRDEIRLETLQFCDDLIKENLKDPRSYKRINSRNEQIRTGVIKYTATNSFGGRVAESFECFDPRRM